MMLICGPLVPRWLELALLKVLDESAEMSSIAKVERQIGDLRLGERERD